MFLECGESLIKIFEKNGDSVRETNVECIYSPVDFELNSKKILNKVYKELHDIAKEEFWEKEQEVNMVIAEFLDAIFQKVPYHLEHSVELPLDEILKDYKVKLVEDYSTLLEKLCIYVKIHSQIFRTKVLVLCGIHDFLTLKEIDELYKTAFYSKVNLLLLESHQKEKSEFEHTYILDRSDCLIEF